MKTRKGNVEIIFVVFAMTILIILCFAIYILYIQITTYIIPIKQDLFYIVQNSYFSLNQNDLEYEEYVIDNNILKKQVNQILSKNHPYAKLNSIYYNSNDNKVYIQIMVDIKPIVLEDYIGDIKITINDVIKLKMMEVK